MAVATTDPTTLSAATPAPGDGNGVCSGSDKGGGGGRHGRRHRGGQVHEMAAVACKRARRGCPRDPFLQRPLPRQAAPCPCWSGSPRFRGPKNREADLNDNLGRVQPHRQGCAHRRAAALMEAAAAVNAAAALAAAAAAAAAATAATATANAAAHPLQGGRRGRCHLVLAPPPPYPLPTPLPLRLQTPLPQQLFGWQRRRPSAPPSASSFAPSACGWLWSSRRQRRRRRRAATPAARRYLTNRYNFF